MFTVSLARQKSPTPASREIKERFWEQNEKKHGIDFEERYLWDGSRGGIRASLRDAAPMGSQGTELECPLTASIVDLNMCHTEHDYSDRTDREHSSSFGIA
jgi:hypothetical protein